MGPELRRGDLCQRSKVAQEPDPVGSSLRLQPALRTRDLPVPTKEIAPGKDTEDTGMATTSLRRHYLRSSSQRVQPYACPCPLQPVYSANQFCNQVFQLYSRAAPVVGWWVTRQITVLPKPLRRGQF